MINHKLIALLGLLSLFCDVCQSQNYLENYVDTYAINGKIWNAENVAVGHPLFLEEWANGGIIIVPNQQIQNVLLALDIESGKLLYQSKEGKVSTVKESKVSSFYLIDSNGDSTHFINAGFNGFMQKLEGKSTLLLKKHVKKIKKAEKFDGYNASQAEDRYVYSFSYFLIKGEDIIEITSKKAFLEFWKESADVLNYIKENKLKHNNEDDLKTIVRFAQNKQ